MPEPFAIKCNRCSSRKCGQIRIEDGYICPDCIRELIAEGKTAYERGLNDGLEEAANKLKSEKFLPYLRDNFGTACTNWDQIFRRCADEIRALNRDQKC